MIRITAVPRRFASAVKRRTLAPAFSAARGFQGVAATLQEPHAEHLVSPLAAWAPGSRGFHSSAPAFGALDLEGERDAAWYTGKQPLAGQCPGVDANGKIHALPLTRLDGSASRQDALDAFDNIWAIDETLMAGLQGEEAFHRAPYHNLRHPMIFYYGHTAAVFVNKLRVAGVLTDPVNPYFESIFETGVDEMSWDDLSKNEMAWPSVAEVHAYRQTVYNLVTEAIASHPDLAGGAVVDQSSPMWALFMGIEHLKIHIETSSVLLREMPLAFVRHPAAWPDVCPTPTEAQRAPQAGADYPQNELVHVEAAEVTMGKDQSQCPTYGWDNEYGSRVFNVGPFDASKNIITNGEFWEFTKAEGYMDESLWEPEGWDWRTFRNARWPCWWVRDGPSGLHHYRLRTVFEEVVMPWDWPAAVNYHEAKAYCNWKAREEGLEAGTYRLMTEPEHYHLRDYSSAPLSVDPALGVDTSANVSIMHGSESPVGAYPTSQSGFNDLVGSVWEWGEGHFCALPGFKVHQYYADFSSPCFDGKHNMILGGSFISSGANGASRFSRYAFRPHFFQHAGFRMVKASDPSVVPTSCAGSPGPHVGTWRGRVSAAAAATQALAEEQQLHNVMAAHYGEVNTKTAAMIEGGEFAQRCAELASKHCGGKGKALDLGCSVGRLSFELARQGFEDVVGMDLSETAVAAAKALQQGHGVPYELYEEGDVAVAGTAAAPKDVELGKVTFMMGDAMCIPAHFSGFDAVVLANVIDELPSPAGPLSRMGGVQALVNPGGVVVVASPYTWLGGGTPKEAWLGGFTGDDGEVVRTVDGIREALGPDFELVEETTLSQIIPESARTFRLSLPHVTVWRRRS